MSGLVKGKEYDVKDSNVENIGSDMDRKVKKESAKTELAWKGAGSELGIQIWRIEKFKVRHWPKEQYGQFYDGDSYILLNTYNEADSQELLYDVHFWIGKDSSQDEYGTAAYKTVEIDNLLDDKPVQHREVQGSESELFKSYFETFTILHGGVDSGFNHVTVEEYKPRLFLVKQVGKRQVLVTERPACKCLLNEEDVFIIDSGNHLYQVNGAKCQHQEKYKGSQAMQKIEISRPGKIKRKEVVEQSQMSPDHPLMKCLAEGPAPEEEDEPSDADTFVPTLLRISDASGKMKTTRVSQGNINRDMLKSEDVFIIDIGTEMFVWIGKRASRGERKNGLQYANEYLATTGHRNSPATVYEEGKERPEFNRIFH